MFYRQFGNIEKFKFLKWMEQNINNFYFFLNFRHHTKIKFLQNNGNICCHVYRETWTMSGNEEQIKFLKRVSSHRQSRRKLN